MNSKNLLEHYGRFKGLEWFNRLSQSRILVGGAGGIGSWLSFFLVRTGAEVITFDLDYTDKGNLAGQMYGNQHVGKSKVEALGEVINYLCGTPNYIPVELEIKAEGPWKEVVEESDVVCVGFDNLEARRLLYDYWKEKGKETSLFIDGRLGAESLQIFVVDKQAPESDFKAYEATYFSKEERMEVPCTVKATTHCGAMIASYMTSLITNWMSNLEGSSRTVCNIEIHLPIMLSSYFQFPEPVIAEEHVSV